MHYSQLVKIGNDNTVHPQQGAPGVNNVFNNNNDDTKEELRMLRSELQEFLANNKPVNPPPVLVESELTDDEINNVLNCLLILQDKYFPDIPLSDELCHYFMWNIPREVYKTFVDSNDYMLGDLMNPMLLLYIFCAKDVRVNYGLFMKRLLTELSGDEDMMDEVLKSASIIQSFEEYSVSDEEN